MCLWNTNAPDNFNLANNFQTASVRALIFHSVKNNGTHGKFLSQGILMWNIKALALTVKKSY